MECGEGNGVPPCTSVIAGWKDVEALARGAEYQHGSAHLEIKRDFQFGASTVKLVARKVSKHFRISWSPQVLKLCIDI